MERHTSDLSVGSPQYLDAPAAYAASVEAQLANNAIQLKLRAVIREVGGAERLEREHLEHCFRAGVRAALTYRRSCGYAFRTVGEPGVK